MKALLTDEFIAYYSEFGTLESFFQSSLWTIESEADFEAIPADAFDIYVDEHTDFGSWKAMFHAAGREYVLRKVTEQSTESFQTASYSVASSS